MDKSTRGGSNAAHPGRLPKAWEAFLGPAALAELDKIMLGLASLGESYYPEGGVFAAFDLCSPQDVKVVIVGQDPYHGAGEAHGMAFSVSGQRRLPPSLRNIVKELKADLGAAGDPISGDLSAWARQGVLLINSVLTVAPNAPGSHYGLGWEEWTDGVLAALSAKRPRPVFVLWGGKAARKKKSLAPRSLIVEGAHPSPLAANRGGFFGGRYFSKTNAFLVAEGVGPIHWESILAPRLPESGRQGA